MNSDKAKERRRRIEDQMLGRSQLSVVQSALGYDWAELMPISDALVEQKPARG